MAAKSKWFRLNVDWDDSIWVSSLSESGQLAWVKLIGYIKKEGKRGSVKALTIERISSKWNMKPKGVKEMFDKAHEDGAVQTINGEWSISHWTIYQPDDKTAARRQQDFRDNLNSHNGVMEQSETLEDQHNAVMCALCSDDNGVMLSREPLTTNHIHISKDITIGGKPPKAVIENSYLEGLWSEFESIYPKRDGDLMKKKGREKFMTLMKSGIDADAVLMGLERYAKWIGAKEWRGTSYVKQMTTWLNGSCWLEMYEITSKTYPNGHSSGQSNGTINLRLTPKGERPE